MNNFPAMTEAQRQELISDLRILLLDKDGEDKTPGTLIARIALAALTAESDITVMFDKHRREGNTLANYNEMPVVISCNWKPDGEHRYYTAPPAPVLRVPDGWIKCSERMPEMDTKVLLLFTQYDNHIEDGFIGDEGDDFGWYHYLYDGDALQSNPTHWMPLPAPPETSNEQ